jgi:hypothetical protein
VCETAILPRTPRAPVVHRLTHRLLAAMVDGSEEPIYATLVATVGAPPVRCTEDREAAELRWSSPPNL